MPAKLIAHVPGSVPQMYVIDDDATVVIGRDPTCDLVLAHESVSRRHAQLSRVDDRWTVRDLDSKNGTRVDGDRIGDAHLESSAWFAIGDVFCEFQPVDETQRDRLLARGDERRHASTLWSARLAAAPDESRLLGTLMKGIVELAECRRGFIVMSDGDAPLEVRACYGLSPQDMAGTSFSGSRGAVDRVVAERRAVFLSDRHDRAWLKDRGSVVAQGIQALAALPLEHEGELLGIAYADTDDMAREFTQLDAELLLAFAGHAATSLAVAKLDRRLGALSTWLAVDDGGSVHRREGATAWHELASATDRFPPP